MNRTAKKSNPPRVLTQWT